MNNGASRFADWLHESDDKGRLSRERARLDKEFESVWLPYGSGVVTITAREEIPQLLWIPFPTASVPNPDPALFAQIKFQNATFLQDKSTVDPWCDMHKPFSEWCDKIEQELAKQAVDSAINKVEG